MRNKFARVMLAWLMLLSFGQTILPQVQTTQTPQQDPAVQIDLTSRGQQSVKDKSISWRKWVKTCYDAEMKDCVKPGDARKRSKQMYMRQSIVEAKNFAEPGSEEAKLLAEYMAVERQITTQRRATKSRRSQSSRSGQNSSSVVQSYDDSDLKAKLTALQTKVNEQKEEIKALKTRVSQLEESIKPNAGNKTPETSPIPTPTPNTANQSDTTTVTDEGSETGWMAWVVSGIYQGFNFLWSVLYWLIIVLVSIGISILLVYALLKLLRKAKDWWDNRKEAKLQSGSLNLKQGQASEAKIKVDPLNELRLKISQQGPTDSEETPPESEPEGDEDPLNPS